MGHKIRTNSAAGKPKAATSAKVANKTKNKSMRSKFRVEKEAKKASESKKLLVNPFLSAETGVVAAYNPNTKRAKKAIVKAKRKMDAAKKEVKMKERHAPIRPEDVLKVLHGRASAVAIAEKNQHGKRSAEAMDNSGSDSEVDAKAKKAADKLKKKEEKTGKFIPPKMAAMLKAQGKDIKEIMEMRAKIAADKAAKTVRANAVAAAMKEFDPTGSEYSNVKPISDSEGSDLEDDEEAFARYVNFFESREEDIKNAPVREKVRKDRIKERVRERQLAMERGSDSESNDDDSDVQADSEADDVDSLVMDGPDASDEEGDVNVFGDVMAAVEKESLAAMREKSAKKKQMRKNVEDEEEERLQNFEARTAQRAAKQQELAIDGDSLKVRGGVGIAGKTGKKLLIRSEDGTWVAQDATAEIEDDESLKPNLSAYVREAKQKKVKAIPKDEYDPRNSRALDAARSLSKSVEDEVQSMVSKANATPDLNQDIDDDLDENNFSDGDVSEDGADLPAPVVEMTLEEFQEARMLRIRKVQVIIADLCQEILVNPEKYFPAGHAKALVDLCKDQDKTIRQLALVSLTQVMLDVMPGYRIRIPTSDELKRESQGGKKVSRDIAKMRKYEKSLLDTYASLISILRSSVRAVIANKNHSTRVSSAEATQENGLPLVSLGCLCRLFERGHSFNLSKEIATFLAAILTSRYERFRDLVARTVVQVFRLDVSGEATLEIVKAIAQVFKNRGGDKVRAPLLSVLLHVPLSREVLNAEVGPKGSKATKKKELKGPGVNNWARDQQKQQEVKAKLKAKMKRGKLDDDTFSKITSTLNPRAPKEVDERALSRDVAEGEAEISIAQRKKVQSATLAMVFTIYFRYLKQAPTLKSLYSRDTHADTESMVKETARKVAEEEKLRKEVEERGEVYVPRQKAWTPPMPPAPPSHLLLTAVLKGVCQFSHLINLELVLDLLEHLKQVIGASASAFTFSPTADSEARDKEAREAANLAANPAAPLSNNALYKKRQQFDRTKVDENGNRGSLPLRSALLCVHTSFSLFKMYSNALTIDLHAFYTHYYEMLWQLVLPHELCFLPLALDCWELMLLSPRLLPPARVAALCRRFLIVAATMRPSLSLAVVHAVGLALQRHPRAAALLENDGMNSGSYDALVPDPDVSHSLGSPGWDLTLLPVGFHPFGPRFVGHAFAVPEVVQAFTGDRAEGHNPNAQPVKKRPDEDERDRGGYGASQITITVGNERVNLSRLQPQHVLRILDTSRGAFVPDIPSPPPASMAITHPHTVTPSLLKQALSRAAAARRTALNAPFDPTSLVPSHLRSVFCSTQQESSSEPKAKRQKMKGSQHVSTVNETVWLATPLEKSFSSVTYSRAKKDIRERLEYLSTMASLYLARKSGMYSPVVPASMYADVQLSDDEEDVEEDAEIEMDMEDTMEYEGEDDEDEEEMMDDEE